MAGDRYAKFRKTPQGRCLVALAEDPTRYPEYAALSRVNVPAVAALVHEISRDHPEIELDNFAKQAIGAFVGTVMSEHGHRILRRGRVQGSVFTYGAIWSAFPQT